MMLGEFEIRGDETGRVWRAHLARQVEAPGSGARFRATAEDGEVVLLHRLSKDIYDEEIARANGAIELGRRREIQACPFFRQLIDVMDTETTLWVIYEWADQSLREAFLAGSVSDNDVVQIGRNVSQALRTLHALDLVHCDVAPPNILRVRALWKLADLDNCVDRGTPLARFAPPRYRHDAAQAGAPADPRFDLFGLDRVLAQLRGE